MFLFLIIIIIYIICQQLYRLTWVTRHSDKEREDISLSVDVEMANMSNGTNGTPGVKETKVTEEGAFKCWPFVTCFLLTFLKPEKKITAINSGNRNKSCHYFYNRFCQN